MKPGMARNTKKKKKHSSIPTSGAKYPEIIRLPFNRCTLFQYLSIQKCRASPVD